MPAAISAGSTLWACAAPGPARMTAETARALAVPKAECRRGSLLSCFNTQVPHCSKMVGWDEFLRSPSYISATTDRMHMDMRHLTLPLIALLGWSCAAGAQDLRRATVWDLKLGEPIAAQPS